MSRIGSVATGAVSGAGAGSAFGPIGTIGGAILGGVGGYFSGKKKDQLKKLPTMSPEAQQAYQQYIRNLQSQGGPGGSYSLGQDYLQNMLSGNPEEYNKWAAPYQTQFQQQVIPGIAERFAGLGGGLGGGTMGSSGFAQALGGAGAQFSSNLAGLYAQLRQQAAQQAFSNYNNMSNLGFNTSPFMYAYQPGNLGAVGGIASGIGQLAARAGGTRFGENFGNLDWFNRGNQNTAMNQDNEVKQNTAMNPAAQGNFGSYNDLRGDLANISANQEKLSNLYSQYNTNPYEYVPNYMQRNF